MFLNVQLRAKIVFDIRIVSRLSDWNHLNNEDVFYYTNKWLASRELSAIEETFLWNY